MPSDPHELEPPGRYGLANLAGATPRPNGEIARRLPQEAHRVAAVDTALLRSDLVAAFLASYANRRGTQETYKRILGMWLRWLDEAGIACFDVTTATIERFSWRPLPNGAMRSPNTIALDMACLASFYRTVAHAGYMAANPVDAATRPARPAISEREWDMETSRQLVRTARTVGDREALLVLLYLGMALHASEAVGIDITDVGGTRERPMLRINADHPTKRATLRMHPVMLDAALRLAEGRAAGPLFITSVGTGMARQFAHQIVRCVGARIGLRDLTPRDLRRGFVVLAVQAGTSMHDARRAARYKEGPRRRYVRAPDSIGPHPSLRVLEVLLDE